MKKRSVYTLRNANHMSINHAFRNPPVVMKNGILYERIQRVDRLVARTSDAAVVATLSDLAVGTLSASGDSLPGDLALVADTELSGAVADNGTVLRARAGAGSSASAGAASGGSSSGRRSSGGRGRSSSSGRRGSDGSSQGGRNNAGESAGSTRGEDGVRCSWLGGSTSLGRLGGTGGRSSRGRATSSRSRLGSWGRGSTASAGGRSVIRTSGRGSTAAANRGDTSAIALDILAGVGELDDLVLDLLARGGVPVDEEGVGESIESGGIAGSTRDLDGCTVHVQLRLTGHLGVPGPSECTLSAGDRVGEGESELLGGAVETRASTLDRLDNLELGVGSWGGILGVAELARSTTVDGSALEGDLLLLADLHVVHLGDSEAILDLARELSSGDRAVVDLVVAVRDGRLHDNVRAGGGNERGGCQKCGAERHLEGVGKTEKCCGAKFVGMNV